MHAIVHAADIQDRDDGALVMATLFGMFPFLPKLYADGGYQGPIFPRAPKKVTSRVNIEIVNRSDVAKKFVVLPKRWIVERTFAWLGPDDISFVRGWRIVRVSRLRAVGRWRRRGLRAFAPSLCAAGLQLGEDLFDGIEIGRVFGQEEQFSRRCSDRLTNGFSFVAAEIVHHDDVSRQKRGRQYGLDIGFEALAVDRTVKNPRRLDAIIPKGGHEGHGFPMAMRNFADKPVASRRPSPQRRHIGLGPRLIDENRALRRDPALTLNPAGAPLRHVGTIALAGHVGFF